jgi:hypothetical protein
VQRLLVAILMKRGAYTGAAEHMRHYLLLAPDAPDSERMKNELPKLDRLSLLS